MPNVFLLCEYPTLAGGEQSMLGTLDGVRAAGFEPVVAAPPEGPLADAVLARGVRLVPLKLHDAAGARLPQDRLRRQLAGLLHRRPVDLLHANSLAMGRLSGPVAAELGLKSIAHLRDIINLSKQAVADLNCHTRLLAVSQATRDSHAACGLATEKLHVVYNGVDLRRFRPRAATGYLHRELQLPPDALLIGAIGQICLRKGQDVLARAAATLSGRLPDAHYLIVGERFSAKDESREFEASIRAAATGGLAGRFHFLGFRGDVDRLLSELALLVHPARQEPLGRVLLEAAASGVAVIATDVGGTREIFPPPSHSARLVPPDDADALAAAIRELAADGRLRGRLAASARRRAEEAFDIERATAVLVDHYRQLTGGLPTARKT